MWPAVVELLAIAAAISSIVAYSARRSSARHHREVDGKMAAKGNPNSRSPINPAQTETEEYSLAASQAAGGQRERESETFGGRSR